MTKSFRIFAVAFLSLFLLPLAASAYDVTASLQQIDQYALSTGATADEATLLKAYAVFAPEKLPATLRIESVQNENWFCATPAILTLQQASINASPKVRQEIEKLVPWKTNFNSEPVADAKAGIDYNPNGVDPGSYNNYQTEHFNFYWGDDAEYDLSDMQNWGTIFEEVWDIEVDQWGWDDVYLTDQYYVDVYLGNSGGDIPNINFQGAYTTLYSNYQPFMVFHPDLLAHDNYLKDVSAHEFFHCMQFTVAVMDGGCYSYMGQENNWGIEGTAVWAEDEAFDDINYYKYQIDSWTNAPQSSLITEDFYQIYARVIWWKFVTEKFDGRETIYDLFHGVCRGSLLDSLKAIYRDEQTDLYDEFTEFARGNLFLSDTYEEGSSYSDFSISKKISSFPDSFSPTTSRSAQLLGMNYIKLTPEGDKNYLTIDFEGETKVGGRPFDQWTIQILAMKSDKADDDYDLITMLPDEDGMGTASVEGFGTDYELVYVIVTPLDEEPRSFSGSEYTISFDVTDAPATDDDDDESDDDDDSSSDDDDDNDSSSDDDDDDDDDDSGCCG